MRKFTKSIETALAEWLKKDPFFEIYALGANYPQGVDGSHGELSIQFPNRLRDVPASESTFTGLALGRAISGKRTLVHHGRSEFAIFAADQIATQAAKWRYQFGGTVDVPLTVRVALGRQWGNGPQHTASYLQFFSSIPGLRVVMPSSPNSAYQLLSLSIASNDPVVFLEPRWLYSLEQQEDLEVDFARESFSKSFQRIRTGSKMAVVTYGEGVVEAVISLENGGFKDVSVYDFWQLTPGSGDDLISELQKYPVVLFVDPYCSTGGPLVEILSRLACLRLNQDLNMLRIPNVPVPTATTLTEAFYINSNAIGLRIANELGQGYQESKLSFQRLHLPPKIGLDKNWRILKS